MDEAAHKKKFKPINIRDLIMAKNPKMSRWVPGFICRLLSRILRIDVMNDPILYKRGYKKDVDFARASIEVFNLSLDVKGREHLSRNYPPLKALVNDILTNVKNMDGIFVPINKHGAQAKRDIIPIHLNGRCSNFFYNLANIRKFLGIKTKLEMFFLPKESYKHRNKHFVITFVKAIPYQTFDNRFSPLQWAARVKDYTYSLVENPEGEFSYLNN